MGTSLIPFREVPMIAMAILLGGVIFSSLPPGVKFFTILLFVAIATKSRE